MTCLRAISSALLSTTFVLLYLSKAATAQVKVIENFFSPEELAGYRDAELDPKLTVKGRKRAAVFLPTSHVERIRATTVQENNQGEEQCVVNTGHMENDFPLVYKTTDEDEKGVVEFRITEFDKSTGRHIDLVDNENVAVVFLNTNPHAFLVQGDQSIPVVAGTFTSFPGTVVHDLVIKQGNARVLGPFGTKSLACDTLICVVVDTEEPSSSIPTEEPSSSIPTEEPSSSIPTEMPTVMPTEEPSSSMPTEMPSNTLTEMPSSSKPTEMPTSGMPSEIPTSTMPSKAPTDEDDKKQGLFKKIKKWFMDLFGF